MSEGIKSNRRCEPQQDVGVDHGGMLQVVDEFARMDSAACFDAERGLYVPVVKDTSARGWPCLPMRGQGPDTLQPWPARLLVALARSGGLGFPLVPGPGNRGSASAGAPEGPASPSTEGTRQWAAGRVLEAGVAASRCAFLESQLDLSRWERMREPAPGFLREGGELGPAYARVFEPVFGPLPESSDRSESSGRDWTDGNPADGGARRPKVFVADRTFALTEALLLNPEVLARGRREGVTLVWADMAGLVACLAWREHVYAVVELSVPAARRLGARGVAGLLDPFRRGFLPSEELERLVGSDLAGGCAVASLPLDEEAGDFIPTFVGGSSARQLKGVGRPVSPPGLEGEVDAECVDARAVALGLVACMAQLGRAGREGRAGEGRSLWSD